MPRVFEEDGFRFFFFSNEGDPKEPCHIHVRKGNGLAKFWVEPDVRLADSVGFTSKDLKNIKIMIQSKRQLIKEAWNEFFFE